MKTSKLTILIPSLCVVALVGRAVLSDSGDDISHHRLALESLVGCTQGLRKSAKARKMKEADPTIEGEKGLILDISIKEEEKEKGKYDMTVEVGPAPLKKGRGKPGKPSPFEARAIKKIVDKLGEGEGRFVYAFPNGHAKDFHPAYLLEIEMDINTAAEHLQFDIAEKDTNKRLYLRQATENHGKVTYRCPLNVGKYVVRLIDGEGRVLGEGDYGHMNVKVNKHHLMDDSVSGGEFEVISSGLDNADIV